MDSSTFDPLPWCRRPPSLPPSPTPSRRRLSHQRPAIERKWQLAVERRLQRAVSVSVSVSHQVSSISSIMLFHVSCVGSSSSRSVRVGLDVPLDNFLAACELQLAVPCAQSPPFTNHHSRSRQSISTLNSHHIAYYRRRPSARLAGAGEEPSGPRDASPPLSCSESAASPSARRQRPSGPSSSRCWEGACAACCLLSLLVIVRLPPLLPEKVKPKQKKKRASLARA